MKVALFSTKKYDQQFFEIANVNGIHEISYFEASLNKDTINLTEGFGAVCVFVNDSIDKTVIDKLAKNGIKLIALRCAGFNNIDVKAALENNIKIVRVPAYSPQAVAEHAVKRVKRSLSEKYPPSSLPGEAPASRTGTLRDSIHWRRGVESRQFPGPASNSASDEKRFASKKPADYAWREKIQREAFSDNSIITPYPARQNKSIGTRIIQVNPRAVDRSERSRLEYYSFFLETGWYSKGNDGFNDKRPKKQGEGEKIKRQSVPKGDKREGPKWNPPRPYLSRLAWPEIAKELEGVYKAYLRDKLPAAFKSLADKATLKVTYNRGLRVPYISDNKNRL